MTTQHFEEIKLIICFCAYVHIRLTLTTAGVHDKKKKKDIGQAKNIQLLYYIVSEWCEA